MANPSRVGSEFGLVDVRIVKGNGNAETLAELASHSPAMSYHCHNSIELVVLRDGSGEYFVNDEIVKFTSKCVYVIGKDIPHRTLSFSNEGFDGVLVHLSDRFVSSVVAECGSVADKEFADGFMHGWAFRDETVTERIYSLTRRLSRAVGVAQVALLAEILDYLARNRDKAVALTAGSRPSVSKGCYEDAVSRVYEYTYGHFTECVRLSDIAEYANMNKSALCRLFRKVTGNTVFQHINRLRIGKACQLLRTTDLNATEIAYMAGYNNFTHFSSQFREFIGMTATAYREKLK